MEKIKVNMSPNPLDVQTIHASQNDGEARQWEFELHNNGELIDTSEVKEQLVFKAYKGGTEQLLPENGSTPTTSPFKGDIRYPQGLLTDQEFTYRQSPTEEDGLAKITDIKGNTIVWNQLVQNGNFADTSRWAKGSGVSSLVISNNEAVITIGGTWNNDVRQYQGASFINGHKYFASFEAKATAPITLALASLNTTPTINFAIMANVQTTFRKIASIVTARSNANDFRIVLDGNGSSYAGETFTLRNVQIIDLTAMGLDISSPSDFTSLFPLSYYSYNQGSLLSFNGNGIKTVGFNQWDEEWVNGSIDVNTGAVAGGTNVVAKNYIPAFSSANYCATVRLRLFFYDEGKNFISYLDVNADTVFTTPSNCHFILFTAFQAYGTTYKNDICISISDTSKNGTYEPYTSSTLSLPISTYFPSGIKSAGSVYDELTESKAITRVGAVDLGTLTYTIDAGNTLYAPVTGLKGVGQSEMPNILCALFTPIKYSDRGSVSYPNISITSDLNIRFGNTGYTDATAFKTAMSGVYLYYELATESETSFTTASLVTENAEIPLSNEDGTLICKCTEQLSENPGFFDAKIKLSDSDGTCYSNKLQLHVERKPS